MKNFLIFASLLLCTPLTTFTMESHGCQKIDSDFDEIWNTLDTPSTPQTSTTSPTQTSIKQPQQDISDDKLLEFATLLKIAINKKCTAINIWGTEYQLRSDDLKEKDFFDIMKIIEKYADTYDFIKTDFMKTFDFIMKQSWYSRNFVEGKISPQNYLQDTFIYFVDLATKNINNVTSQTFNKVKYVNEIQSIPQLNKLPQYMRKFFMSCAYCKINPSYDIILTGHTDAITAVDVHAATHRAATSSYDKTLRLWDLTTGKPICTFPGNNNGAHHITFNTDGTRLATTADLKNNSNIIRIWDIQSKELLCKKKIQIPEINSLSYKNQTLLIGSGDNPPKISLFLIRNDEIMEMEQEIDVPQHTKKDSFCRTWDNYSVYSHLMNKQTIAITKKNCRDLYIYQQAIKNDSLNFNVETIDKTDFTEYEKDMLYKQLITQQTTQKF